MANYRLLATSAFGIESTVSKEVKRLGFTNIEVENGRIMYDGDERAIIKSNLWLRTADRVYIVLARFKALTFSHIFDEVRAMDWKSMMPHDARIVVNASSVKSTLFSLSDIQSITKKAIVDAMKEDGSDEWLPETGDKFSIRVSILKDDCLVLLDTSGDGLHKRGYRKDANEAPIKETLAAAIISVSNWRGAIPLIDPMCGTGTFAIEAALYARNIAPGLLRSFAGENFPFISPDMWKDERREAMKAIDNEREVHIVGSDIDRISIEIARSNAEIAGVDLDIEFMVRDFKDIGSEFEKGYIITNPPYGERLSNRIEVQTLYEDMGRAFGRLAGFQKHVITSHEDFEKYYGRKADRNRKLYNGKLKCYLYSYEGAK